MTAIPRFLLIQIRDQDDPIRWQEIECFARALDCPTEQIEVFDLLRTTLTLPQLSEIRMVLIGGSGRYSATSDEPWMDRALDSLRLLHESRTPTFASCWGCQAMARACGGEVVHDMNHAELGTGTISLTADGMSDPLFGSLPAEFKGYMGHEDRVSVLPPDAVLLATNYANPVQAYRFLDRPIYCTQFHPELTLATLLSRIEAYPEYCERIARMPFADFRKSCVEAPESERLLRIFRELQDA